MKTKWSVLIVAGAVIVLLGSQVIGQSRGGGQGWGPGPAHRAGNPNQAGLDAVPHRGGPMAGCVFCCPFGPANSSVLGPMAWSLNLTDEQIKKIRGVYDQARADANSVTQAVASASAGLQDAIASGAAEAQVRAAATALSTAIANQAVFHAKVLTSVKAVLTDDQRKELDKIPAKMQTLQHNAQGQNPATATGDAGAVPHNGQGPGQPTPHTGGAGQSMTLDQMFKAADTNNDGVLTLDELNAFQSKTGGQVRHQ